MAICVALLVILFAPSIVSADDVEKYIQNLRDEKYEIRENAARSLGGLNDTRAVDPLIHALNDRISGVRSVAASSLGELNDTSAVDPLIHALSDNDRIVRTAAAHSLGEIGDTRAVDPLIQMLRRETNDGTRGCIAIALGKIGDPRAVDPLIQELRHGNIGCGCTGKNPYSALSAMLNSGVIEALGEIGDSRAIGPLSKLLSIDVDIRMGFCHSYQPGQAAEALEKIARRGNRQATDALINALSNIPYPYKGDTFAILNRVRMVIALVNVGDPRSVDVLIKVSDNENEDGSVRIAAQDALKNLPTL